MDLPSLPGRRLVFAALFCMTSVSAIAAEWSVTPGLGLMVQHNDNVTLRSQDELSSMGYSVSPKLFLDGRDDNWDAKLSSVVKSTRYSDLNNSDSDNYFFDLSGGYNTETQRFGLNTSFTRNNTYDTDFDTQLPGAQLVDDHTERETTLIAPTWQWEMMETGLLDVSLTRQDVEYDEVVSQSYEDYTLDVASVRYSWFVSQRSRLGFNLQMQQYASQESPFDYQGESYSSYTEFDNQVYRLEYNYLFSESSRLDVSAGKRRTTTTFHDTFTGCLLVVGPFCAIYEVGNIEITDDGADLELSFSHSNEVSSFDLSVSRMVQPASFGGAQEIDKLVFRHKYSWSERIRSSVLLEAYKTTSIDGLDAVNDRERYRFEPRLIWKLTKDWRLDFTYRHISQTFAQSDNESQSNTYMIELNMLWPKLFSTF